MDIINIIIMWGVITTTIGFVITFVGCAIKLILSNI